MVRGCTIPRPYVRSAPLISAKSCMKVFVAFSVMPLVAARRSVGRRDDADRDGAGDGLADAGFGAGDCLADAGFGAGALITACFFGLASAMSVVERGYGDELHLPSKHKAKNGFDDYV